MVPVQISVATNLNRVVLMVRAAMEADAAASVREEIPLGELIHTARQIAGTEHRDDPSDVRAERQRDEIPVHPDVVVELLGNAGRQVEFRDVARGLCGEFDPALDLADLLRGLVDGPYVGRSELAAQPIELRDERVENAPGLFHGFSLEDSLQFAGLSKTT